MRLNRICTTAMRSWLLLLPAPKLQCLAATGFTVRLQLYVPLPAWTAALLLTG